MVNILDINPECFMVGNVKECTNECAKRVYHTLFLII